MEDLIDRVKKRDLKLKTLDLWSPQVTDWQFSTLCQLLCDVQHVTRLSLACMYMNRRRLIDLGKMIGNNTSLVELQLTPPDGATKNIENLWEGLKTNHTLKVLDLRRMQVTNTDLDGLLRVLETNTSLMHLDLSCDRELDSGSALSRIAACGSAITRVEMDFIKFDDKSVYDIARVLRVNQGNLTELSITGCGINVEGSFKIAEALCVNTKLTYLSYSGNICRDVGGMAMAKMLSVNNTLERLNLDDTRLRGAAGSAIYKALADNTTLRTLDLDRNYIVDVDIALLYNTLRVNSTLTELNNMDGDCRIEYDHETQLTKDACLNRNKTLYALTLDALDLIHYQKKSLKKQRIE